MKHVKYYLPGIAVILMSVLIIVVPEILVAMLSVFILMTGIFILYIGHGLRKSEIEWKRMDGRFRTPGWHRYCFFTEDRLKKHSINSNRK